AVAQRDDVVLARVFLEQRALAEPAARGNAGERHGLAGGGYVAHLDDAAHDADPVLDGIALAADEGACMQVALEEVATNALLLRCVKFAQPRRQRNELFECGHGPRESLTLSVRRQLYRHAYHRLRGQERGAAGWPEIRGRFSGYATSRCNSAA